MTGVSRSLINIGESTDDVEQFDDLEPKKARPESTLSKSLVSKVESQSNTAKDKQNAKDLLDIKKKLADNDVSKSLTNLAQTSAEIVDAFAEYRNIEANGRENIMLANSQFNEVMSLGKQASFDAETKGFVRGENATLNAAAQGQSVQGGIAQSAQRAEETLGILNAITIETNAIRKAYGFERQAIMTAHQIEVAKLNRNNKLITSALSGAAEVNQLSSATKKRKSLDNLI